MGYHEFHWDNHDCRGTAVRWGLKPDADVVPVGEPPSDVKPEPVALGEVEGWDFGKIAVDLLESLSGNAEAPIRNLHGESAADYFAADLHLGSRRGEEGSVLDQLRQQVDDVGNGIAS